MLWQLIKQDHIEQRLVLLNAAVVSDQAKLAKAVHKKADAGPRGADHLRQGLGASWMILRPGPVLAKKTTVSNPGFLSSTIE